MKSVIRVSTIFLFLLALSACGSSSTSVDMPTPLVTQSTDTPTPLVAQSTDTPTPPVVSDDAKCPSDKPFKMGIHAILSPGDEGYDGYYAIGCFDTLEDASAAWTKLIQSHGVDTASVTGHAHLDDDKPKDIDGR